MRAGLPSITSYLDRLPAGVASYPECVVKASLVHNALSERSFGPDVPLPAPVRALVHDPPAVSAWVPEVHFNALMLAIREVHFVGPSDDAYKGWVFEQNKRMLSTPLYRVLFVVVSPDRLLTSTAGRWGAFRRGTTARHVRLGARDIELIVDAPAELYPALVVRGMTGALRAAVECAGAKSVEVDGVQRSPTEVAYRIRWA